VLIQTEVGKAGQVAGAMTSCTVQARQLGQR
jgi:hypothetical protein